MFIHLEALTALAPAGSGIVTRRSTKVRRRPQGRTKQQLITHIGSSAPDGRKAQFPRKATATPADVTSPAGRPPRPLPSAPQRAGTCPTGCTGELHRPAHGGTIESPARRLALARS